MTFTGLTQELCGEALRLIEPSIEVMMQGGTLKRKQGALIVLDPTKRWEPKYGQEPSQAFIDDIVLFGKVWTDSRDMEMPFEDVAIAKAFASWMTGLPSHVVQQLYPHLLRPGWTKWGGSATDGVGGVTAYSGGQWYLDQLIAEMMLAANKAVCLNDVVGEGGIMSDGSIVFIPNRENTAEPGA